MSAMKMYGKTALKKLNKMCSSNVFYGKHKFFLTAAIEIRVFQDILPQ